MCLILLVFIGVIRKDASGKRANWRFGAGCYSQRGWLFGVGGLSAEANYSSAANGIHRSSRCQFSWRSPFIFGSFTMAAPVVLQQSHGEGNTRILRYKLKTNKQLRVRSVRSWRFAAVKQIVARYQMNLRGTETAFWTLQKKRKHPPRKGEVPCIITEAPVWFGSSERRFRASRSCRYTACPSLRPTGGEMSAGKFRAMLLLLFGKFPGARPTFPGRLREKDPPSESWRQWAGRNCGDLLLTFFFRMRTLFRWKAYLILLPEFVL